MKEVVRTCKVCGCKTGKAKLNRYVMNKGRPVLDSLKKMRGRGAYCCKKERCNNLFLEKENKWKKAFRIKQ